MNARDAKAPAAVTVEARGFVNPTPSGLLPLATIDAPQLGIHQALLLLDGRTNRLTLMAACGCSVHADVSPMVNSLASTLANHEPGTAGQPLH